MGLLDLKEEGVHPHAKGEGRSKDKGLHAFASYLLGVIACGLSANTWKEKKLGVKRASTAAAGRGEERRVYNMRKLEGTCACTYPSFGLSSCYGRGTGCYACREREDDRQEEREQADARPRP